MTITVGWLGLEFWSLDIVIYLGFGFCYLEFILFALAL